MIWNLGSATRISTMMSTKMTATAKMMIQLMARFVRETMMMLPRAASPNIKRPMRTR